jgi:hypothetical protein
VVNRAMNDRGEGKREEQCRGGRCDATHFFDV